METDLIAQVATMLGLPPETPTEDIIGRIQSLLDTATKMDDMDEEDLSASKDMALLNTFRDALTVEGVAPSDDEFIVMLQSALDSLAGTPSMKITPCSSRTKATCSTISWASSRRLHAT